MSVLPKALVDLVESLQALPGVGPRSAERYAYFLLKSVPAKSANLAKNLAKLHDSIDYCSKTFALIEKGNKFSPLYTDPSRDRSIVAIVAEPLDVLALEKTGRYSGTYHVLGGLLSPIDGIGPESLKLNNLKKRIKEDGVSEIILATNASVEGESTALYIQDALKVFDIKITRLARGLPIGLDIEYADQITLGRALDGRQII